MLTNKLSSRDGPKFGFAELRPNYSARQRCAIRPNFGTILSRSGMYNVEQSS